MATPARLPELPAEIWEKILLNCAHDGHSLSVRRFACTSGQNLALVKELRAHYSRTGPFLASVWLSYCFGDPGTKRMLWLLENYSVAMDKMPGFGDIGPPTLKKDMQPPPGGCDK